MSSDIKTYNPRSILTSIIGFILGFLFGNEIMQWAGMAIGWMKNNAIPSIYSTFGNMGGTLGAVLMCLALLTTIAMVKRWNILGLVEWVIIGFLTGLVLPLLSPMVISRLSEMGYQIPF